MQMETYIKTGGSSVVIGEIFYNKFLSPKKNKLIKLSKIDDYQNEFNNIDAIKEIENYKEYYSIPDKILGRIDSNNKFFQYVKKFVEKESRQIFDTPLYYFYIDIAGDKEVLDTIFDMMYRNDFSLWKSYDVIYDFSKHILLGLSFLHEKKICHLDIKPENIMVDTQKKKFRIIDFGFSSKEPFHDFITRPKGTPGYFPKNIKDNRITEWLPTIYANDLQIDSTNGKTPIHNNYKLVYKIDSFLFGRTLYYLIYIFKTRKNKYLNCFNFFHLRKNKKGIILHNILISLLDNNIHTRITASDCIKKFFEKKNKIENT